VQPGREKRRPVGEEEDVLGGESLFPLAESVISHAGGGNPQFEVLAYAHGYGGGPKESLGKEERKKGISGGPLSRLGKLRTSCR